MPTPPRRHWYQFSLRTFFVLVTVVCGGFGWWVQRTREWIRQRQEWLTTQHYNPEFGTAGIKLTAVPLQPPAIPTPPGGLWFFGEKGVAQIVVATTIDDQQEAERLFPEAEVLPIYGR